MNTRNAPRKSQASFPNFGGLKSAHSPFIFIFSILALSLFGGASIAATIPGLAPSLKSIEVPYPAGVLDGPNPIVIDKQKAIALGKALFWDMEVGSDGVACATCHFHAGADGRTKNQFSPGKAHLPANPGDPKAFGPIDERGPDLANYQLTKADFPLHRFGDPAKDLPPGIDFVTLQNSMTYNAVASAGTFSGQFVRIKPDGSEECIPLTGAALDQTFNVDGIHTRRVEPRNTPTIINAVLFDRNFWDGRASFLFNGISSSGAREQNAFVWVVDADRLLWKTRLALDNASLASQAIAPLTNDFEMSCRGRSIGDVARKLLKNRPLNKQLIAADDSVLGTAAFFHHVSGKGLNTTYLAMIQAAFAPRYWSAGVKSVFGKPSYSSLGYSQAEANFGLFFGIAVQLYASTLISDDTPFDRANLVVSPALQPGENIKVSSTISDASGTLTAQQLAGLKVFVKGLCNECHSGPIFSTATNRNTIDALTHQASFRPMLSRQKKFFEGRISTIDVGYFNNAAVPSAADAGLAGNDYLGQPLAFADQYLRGLAGIPGGVVEPLPLTLACQFQRPYTTDFALSDLIDDPAGAIGCANPGNAYVPRPEIVANALQDPTDTLFIHGGHVFKTPQLYNVELTGPYMHNGGMATLEQAINSYSRGGNFGLFNPNFDIRNSEKAGSVVQLRFTTTERANLVEFFKALTDERVRFERAPFDHPQLFVADGHPGDHLSILEQSASAQAADSLLEIPAVGSGGNAVPLDTFYDRLPSP